MVVQCIYRAQLTKHDPDGKSARLVIVVQFAYVWTKYHPRLFQHDDQVTQSHQISEEAVGRVVSGTAAHRQCIKLKLSSAEWLVKRVPVGAWPEQASSAESGESDHRDDWPNCKWHFATT